MGNKRGGGRAGRSGVLLSVGAVLLFAVVAGILSSKQCEAVELGVCSVDSHLEQGGNDCNSKGADGVVGAEVFGNGVVEEEEEEFEFDLDFEMSVAEDEYEEDDDDDEYDEADVELEGDESDFEGEDFENEVEGEKEGSEKEEAEEVEYDETDVVVLGGANFTEFVNSRHYALVEFYAPWCGHCKLLGPEYAEAATILKGQAALAKVDATKNDPLAREYNVESYPTLYFFIDGMHSKYPGHNTREEIVAYVLKKTSLTATTLDSEKEAAVVSRENSTVAVALLSSLEGPEVEEVTYAARHEDDVGFYITSNAEAAEVFSIPADIERPALVLLKQQEEKVSWFDGPFKRDAIGAFVTKHKFPLIITFNKENNDLIFKSAIKKQIILFAGQDDFKRLKTDFMEASKALIGKLIFVHLDLDDTEQAGQVTEYFGLKEDKSVVMAYETEENGRKFMMAGDITAQNIKVFGEKFLDDILKPHLKSEPLPETNDDDVKTVVGLNLDEIVLDESKDTFLEIYSRTCGYCQQLEPIWNKLAKRLKPVESIVIAKMDGIANEHDRAKPDGFPTLLFYPAGKKSFDPITFDGDRTVKEFVRFLKREVAIAFTVPKKPDSQDNSSAADMTVEPMSPPSWTTSEEPVSKPDDTTGSEEPGLETVTQSTWSSMKDEL